MGRPEPMSSRPALFRFRLDCGFRSGLGRGLRRGFGARRNDRPFSRCNLARRERRPSRRERRLSWLAGSHALLPGDEGSSWRGRRRIGCRRLPGNQRLLGRLPGFDVRTVDRRSAFFRATIRDTIQGYSFPRPLDGAPIARHGDTWIGRLPRLRWLARRPRHRRPLRFRARVRGLRGRIKGCPVNRRWPNSRRGGRGRLNCLATNRGTNGWHSGGPWLGAHFRKGRGDTGLVLLADAP